MIKVSLVSSSARSMANTYDCLQYLANKLKAKDISTRIIELCKHKIEMCVNCQYECLDNQPCPKKNKDDVLNIWKEILSSKFCIWGVPNYVGFIPALLKALFERQQGILNLIPPQENTSHAVIILATHSHQQVSDSLKEYFSQKKFIHFCHIEPWRKPLEHDKNRNQLDQLISKLVSNLLE